MKRIKMMMMKGSAIALLAAAMFGAGDAAAYEGNAPPPIPCNASNDGTFYTVEYNTYSYIYLCDTTAWTLWSRCSGDEGCIMY